MNNINFREISPSELDQFTENRIDSSFMQSSGMVSLQKDLGNQYKILGLFVDQTLIAAGVYSFRKVIWKYQVALAIQGPMLDYNDPETIQLFFSESKKYLKKNHVIYATILPNIEMGRRDIEGDIVEEANWDFEFCLRKNGYRSFGKINDYKTIMPRFLFVKNFIDDQDKHITDEKALMKSYSVKTRNLIKKAMNNMIRVEDGKDYLDEFITIMEHTGQRRGFASRDKSYYEKFLKHFGEDAKILLATLIPDEAIKDLQQQRNSILSKLDPLLKKQAQGNTKVSGKITELENQLAGKNKSLEFFRKFENPEQKIFLSGALFVKYQEEMVYLYSGSIEEYFGLGAADLIQFEAQKMAINKGCSRYNFYGTFGKYSNSDDGIHAFKKGFGGRVVELPGAYYSVLHPLGRIIEHRYKEK